MSIFQIADTFVALDVAGGARPLQVSENFWEQLARGEFGTLTRLVSAYTFAEDWATWEKHPAGEEFVCLLEGDVDFIFEQDGTKTRLTLDRPGAYVLVPTNTWHTAKVRAPSRVLFITPGDGTEHRTVLGGETS